MGWASAGSIFDPVCKVVLMSNIDTFDSTRILSTLIEALKEGDWDTEMESLDQFRAWPEVVEAFRQNGIYDYCSAEREVFDPVNKRHVNVTCEKEDGHLGLHKDWKGRIWE